MTPEVINVSDRPDDGLGDPDRDAWQKVNRNFAAVGLVADAAIPLVQKAAAGGVAPLDSATRVPLANLQVRRAQFLRAVAALQAGAVKTLLAALSADADDATNIAFWHEPFVLPGGVLAAFTQTTLGLSPTQMTALFAAAATQPN